MAAKPKPPIDPSGPSDAVDLLMADHKRVAKLFAEFDNLKDDGSDRQKAALVEQICSELIVHTMIEEELFYPAVRKAIKDNDLMDEALVEQAGAKQLIAQLQAAKPGEDLYDAKVTVLGEQIDHHVLEEERDMFLQARASGVDTVALGKLMSARKAELSAHPLKLVPTAEGAVPSDEASDGGSADRVRAPKPVPKRPSVPALGAKAKKTASKRQ